MSLGGQGLDIFLRTVGIPSSLARRYKEILYFVHMIHDSGVTLCSVPISLTLTWLPSQTLAGSFHCTVLVSESGFPQISRISSSKRDESEWPTIILYLQHMDQVTTSRFYNFGGSGPTLCKVVMELARTRNITGLHAYMNIRGRHNKRHPQGDISRPYTIHKVLYPLVMLDCTAQLFAT